MWFFSAEPIGYQFDEFSPLHWLMLGLLILVVTVTVVFRKRLRDRPRLRRYLPFAVGGVAWTLEILYHWWTYIQDLNFIFNVVPLELCYISLLLTVVLCITRSRAVFEIYYFTSIGALVSVIFPDMGGFGPDHFRFWHYFICHSFIVWLSAWFLAVEKYTLRRSALLRLFAFLVPLVVLVRFVDWKFSVNYMFLAGPSTTSSPLDFLGSGVWYFVEFLGIAVAVFVIMYLVAPKELRDKASLDAPVDSEVESRQ